MPVSAGAASPMQERRLATASDCPSRPVRLGARVSTFDDDTQLEFFDEPETQEAPGRPHRRMRPRRPGGPRRPTQPPAGAVALARLAGLVALAIAVVVGLVFWVGSCQGKSKHDEYKSYMDKVKPIAQTSAAAGTSLVNALSSAKTVAELHSNLEQGSRVQQQGYDEALRLRPPAALQAAHQQVLGALQLRAIGLTGLADTLADAGSKSAADEASLLAKQAELLTASDLVWANLFRLPATQNMKAVGVRGVIAPPSQIVTNPEPISAHALSEVLQRLNATSSTGKVTGLHGSELLSTEAAVGSNTEQLSASTPTTVDVAANLAFKVTFKNAGHFQEVNVPVTLTVTVIGVGKPVYTKTKHVPSVEAGQTATVSFGDLNLPTSAFGANAAVHVKVGKVPGETNLDNNKATYQVFFSVSNG